MPRHYGEALTEDEVIDRIRQQEEEKKQKRATKQKKGKAAKKKKDENICQGCDGHYDSDDDETQESWIGCDKKGCWRWYHYWCGGELDIPDPKLKWICPACK